MKKLTLIIVVFVFAISVPLIYFVMQTFRSIEQDERDELRYFAETLFDQIEEELNALAVQEESRAIDEYNFYYKPAAGAGFSNPPVSLQQLPVQSYILGYLQNNPDGSFQTPHADLAGPIPSGRTRLIAGLHKINALFNKKRSALSEKIDLQQARRLIDKDVPQRYASRYLHLSRARKSLDRDRYSQRRVEYITVNQILNIVQENLKQAISQSNSAQAPRPQQFPQQTRNPVVRTAQSRTSHPLSGHRRAAALPQSQTLEVEIDPIQSVFLGNQYAFMFRRILFNNQVYRQGAVIKLKDFLAHLVKKTFENQPMARFSNLTIAVTDQNRTLAVARGGSAADDRNFTITRQFPRPFSFISAQLSCASPPRSAGRATLQFMLLVLVAVILLGLFAIYQSSRAVVALSERRSAFVSSVTHELKTPLTTIRMYIEMLEQGIARTPDQQYEYYSILNSETNRLTRLINNVLAFSKLETKQQRLDIQEHDFEAVCREVEKVMALKLRQTDFRLQFNIESKKLFRFDREAMIQILINLIDNSIKFGRSAASREITIRAHASSGRHVISVADTGPGIPHQDLKKIFNNYFRADNDLTRATGGTGIGLALVKSYITSMNGSVCAENNTERGCTITMTLPD